MLSTPDQVKSALPLIHTECCVVKVHGDYLDPRIRNTRAELEDYPSELNQLLSRIYDEFGLVVCGWSATCELARYPQERRSTVRMIAYSAGKAPARRAMCCQLPLANQHVGLPDEPSTSVDSLRRIAGPPLPHA